MQNFNNKFMQINTVKELKNTYLVNGIATIPKNSDNSNYQEIQKWIAQGGVIESYDELAAIKSSKIAEMKAARDAANIEPIIDIEAELLDSEGATTGVMSYFKFYTNRHETNPASDPISILTSCIVGNSSRPYYTQTPEGVDIVVSLTPAIATTLAARMASINDANYQLYRAIETTINSATTTDELDAITIEFE